MFVRFSNLAVTLNKTPKEIITEYPTGFQVKNLNTFINYYPVSVDRIINDRFIFDLFIKFFRFFSSGSLPLKKTAI